MLNALLRVKLEALGAWFTGGTRTKSSGKKIFFALLMLYAVGALAMMFYGLFSQLARGFEAAGCSWLYFALAGMSALGLMFIGSAFSAKAQLFEAKDNELMMALPVKPSMILFSRMLTLMLINVVLELLIIAPALVVWCGTFHLSFSVNGGIITFILFVALNLFATTLSCLVGWLLAVITGRARNKSILTTIFSLVFLALYFWGFSKLNDAISKLVADPNAFANTISAALPIKYFGNAIASGDYMQMLIVLAVLVIPFIILYAVLAKAFTSIVTTKYSAAKIEYKREELKTQAPEKALLKQQLTHLVASSAYLVNAGLGIILMVGGAIAIIVSRSKLLALMPLFDKMQLPIETLIIFAYGIISSMILFTAPSISIEGRTIWLLRTLPIESKRILRSKLNMSNIITVPAMLFLIAVTLICIPVSVEYIPFIIIIPLLLVLLTADIGLITNLRFPYFKWTNEMQAVKQGIAVLISMALSFGIVALPAIVYFITPVNSYPMEFFAAYTVILAILYRLTTHYINNRGAVLFEELQV